MYANFLSMIVGDKDLIWPVWLDTGIQLSTGDSFNLPVGHSQWAWRISGPVVNTRVTFFLGISGAGFFGQTDARPPWSGTIAASTDTSAEVVTATADAASEYLRRNHVERTTVAQGYPADGYGYVGVCNDSNATIESATRGTVTAFPLLRARSLDADPDLGDGLDDVVRALPKDADGIDDPQDALRRAVAMQPFPDGSPLMWDPALGAEIATRATRPAPPPGKVAHTPRALDRVRRHLARYGVWWWVPVLYTLAVIWIYRDLWHQHGTPTGLGWDVIDTHGPDLDFFSREIREDRFSLWNPYDKGGYPVLRRSRSSIATIRSTGRSAGSARCSGPASGSSRSR